MQKYLAVTKALADRNRARVLLFLERGELCVCQIIEMLSLAPSTVSKHLTILYQAGLVESRKEGHWIYYRLPDAPEPYLREALRWARSCLAKDRQITDDAKRLDTVLELERDELCGCYKGVASVHATTKPGRQRR